MRIESGKTARIRPTAATGMGDRCDNERPSNEDRLPERSRLLGLDAAAEWFAALSEQAMTEDWPPVVCLAQVIAAQTTTTRKPAPGRPAALRPLPRA